MKMKKLTNYDVALKSAAFDGRLNIVRCLIESGVADIEATDKKGYTVLMDAIHNNCLDVVKYLIERGADTTVQDPYGNTILTCAACNHYLKLVKYLIEQRNDTLALYLAHPTLTVREAIKELIQNS